MEAYSFNKQLEIGKKGERELDSYFARYYNITIVSAVVERLLKVDRIYKNKDAAQFLVEYKTDHKAAETGNVALEIISVDTDDTPGWVYTSCADYLIYYIPPMKTALFAKMLAIKNSVEEIKESYPKKAIANKGYSTVCSMMKIPEFKELYCQQEFTIPDEYQKSSKRERGSMVCAAGTAKKISVREE